MGIQGKVALVTGGAQGIGLGIAKRLAADGAAIALIDLDQKKLDKAAKRWFDRIRPCTDSRRCCAAGLVPCGTG